MQERGANAASTASFGVPTRCERDQRHDERHPPPRSAHRRARSTARPSRRPGTHRTPRNREDEGSRPSTRLVSGHRRDYPRQSEEVPSMPGEHRSAIIRADGSVTDAPRTVASCRRRFFRSDGGRLVLVRQSLRILAQGDGPPHPVSVCRHCDPGSGRAV